MSNTPLVVALTSIGIAERRAEAFERLLDDHPFVGISGAKLGQLVTTYGDRRAFIERLAVQELHRHELAVKAAKVELFSSSAYGTHISSQTKPGQAR